MTGASSQELFRKAADAEGGMPISAGARVAHVRAAVAAGNSLQLNLSGVPAEKRPELIAAIRQLVDRASSPAPSVQLQVAPKQANEASTSG